MARSPYYRTTSSRVRSASPFVVAFSAALLVSLTFLAAFGGPSSATADTTDAPATDETTGTDTGGTDTGDTGGDPAADAAAEAEAELLREGQQVYTQICSTCHQASGTGIPGQYPPLLDNPKVDDSAYVAATIDNGKQGEIVVLGETYNGVMPTFSTLTDDEVAAVTAYLQNDLQAPAADQEAFAASGGPVAGTELPALTNMTWIVAYALAGLIILLVLAPRLVTVNDRLSFPWLDAWLKTAAILVAVFILVVYVPNWALQRKEVAGLSRFGQDLIGTSLWGLGLLVLLGGLWYAHRESRL